MVSTVSEAEIRAAFEALSRDRIVRELEKHSSSLENGRFVLDLLQRSNHLFFKYPNPKREIARDHLIRELKIYLQKYDSEIQDSLQTIAALIVRVELGYRNLLSILSKIPIRKKSPEIQSSAALLLAVDRLDFVERQAHESIKRTKSLSISDELTGVLDDGTEFHIDAATTGFIENLGTTLTMFAYENGWIAGDETIVLPGLIEVADEELDESQGTEILATGWRRWERTEQRRRYWGGEFIEIAEGRAVTGMPSAVRASFEYIPNDDDLYDWIANERSKEYITQNFAELHYETFAEKKVSGISGSVKLLPDEFVNLREVNSAGYLSTILGLYVHDDLTTYAGLRLVEWLRGYCTLSEIAAQNIEKGGSARDKNLIRFEAGQLEEKLARVGLSSEAALSFLSKTTFATRSADLFDCPLFAMSDGSKILFAPAVIHADPGLTTYSNLMSLGENLEAKGKRFEQQVIKFFIDRGFSPYSINTKRSGSEYQIDVLVPWGNHLFLFECKNKALSGHHPIRSYYFRKERTAAIQQVKRQLQGLLAHPEMSLDAAKVDPRAMIIVPCVLYEQPYSEPGPVDDVFVTDWSSLTRFFKNRYLSSKLPYDLYKRHKLLHRTALYSFWSGEKPAPNDLVRQLADPVQVRIIQSRRVAIESIFVVDENSFGITTEHQRGAVNLSALGRLLGFDASGVRSEEKRVKRMVELLNAKFEKKQIRSQERAFREMNKRRES